MFIVCGHLCDVCLSYAVEIVSKLCGMLVACDYILFNWSELY